LRRMVVLGLTDLLSITLILVRLDLSDQGNEQLSFDMSLRFPDVKYTLLQLLSSEPQRLFVELPDLGASIQVVGLLGFGATSHVYEAFEGGQQVLSSTVCSVGVLSKVLFLTIAISFGTKSAYVMTACKFACGRHQHVCQYERFCLLQASFHKKSEDALTRWAYRLCARLCMEDCIQCAETCHTCQIFRS